MHKEYIAYMRHIMQDNRLTHHHMRSSIVLFVFLYCISRHMGRRLGLYIAYMDIYLVVSTLYFSRDTFILCLVNGGSSFVAGFAIFSVLGFMSYEQGLPISEVAATGKANP